MKKAKLYLSALILISFQFCTSNSKKFHLRMQMVEFGIAPKFKVIEDTITFESKDQISAFKIGKNIVMQKMQKNKLELYYFEIMDDKYSNILNSVSEDDRDSYSLFSIYRKRIDSLHLIID